MKMHSAIPSFLFRFMIFSDTFESSQLCQTGKQFGVHITEEPKIRQFPIILSELGPSRWCQRRTNGSPWMSNAAEAARDVSFCLEVGWMWKGVVYTVFMPSDSITLLYSIDTECIMKRYYVLNSSWRTFEHPINIYI